MIAVSAEPKAVAFISLDFMYSTNTAFTKELYGGNNKSKIYHIIWYLETLQIITVQMWFFYLIPWSGVCIILEIWPKIQLSWFHKQFPILLPVTPALAFTKSSSALSGKSRKLCCQPFVTKKSICGENSLKEIQTVSRPLPLNLAAKALHFNSTVHQGLFVNTTINGFLIGGNPRIILLARIL